MFNTKLKREIESLKAENNKLNAEVERLNGLLVKAEHDIVDYELDLKNTRLHISLWNNSVYQVLMDKYDYDKTAVDKILVKICKKVNDEINKFLNDTCNTYGEGEV